MNGSSPRRLTIVEIREPLQLLDAEYRAYREAAERYHAQTQRILTNVLEMLSDAKSKENVAAHRELERTANPENAEALTKREIQVLVLIAAGSSTKQLASTLGITFKTAVGHRSSLMRKLSIHDTASLVRFAIRAGLIDP